MPHAARVDAFYCETKAVGAEGVTAALELLSDAERQRHDRLVHARDKRDYVIAHALVRVVLGARSGQPPAALLFGATTAGRPYLVPSAAATTPPSFSLSHSRGLVACAIASDGAVGIDVEALQSNVRILEVARRFFSGDEADALERLDDDTRRLRFFELWTLKEALLKARGTGIAGGLDGARFALRDDPGGEPGWCVPATEPWLCWTLDLRPEHLLALAVERPAGGMPAIGVRAVAATDVIAGTMARTAVGAALEQPPASAGAQLRRCAAVNECIP